MSSLVFTLLRFYFVNLHSYFITFLILFTLPTLLFSQGEGNNIIGGGFRMDRLYFETSPDGTRKDIDLGINTKYLRRISPVHSSDSIHYANIGDSQKPISRHWIGVIFGFSGYYRNSDSAITRGTQVFIGPTFRYYASKQLFLETTTLFQYYWSQTRTPDPISPGNWYFPRVQNAGLKWQLGVGYSKRLIRSVYLEPMVGYQVYWKWYATFNNQRPYKLSETSHNFTFSLSLQYSF